MPIALPEREYLIKTFRRIRTIYAMTGLAYRLGPWSIEAKELVNRSLGRAVAQVVLLRGRKASSFYQDPHMFDLVIDGIIKCFRLQF